MRRRLREALTAGVVPNSRRSLLYRTVVSWRCRSPSAVASDSTLSILADRPSLPNSPSTINVTASRRPAGTRPFRPVACVRSREGDDCTQPGRLARKTAACTQAVPSSHPTPEVDFDHSRTTTSPSGRTSPVNEDQSQ